MTRRHRPTGALRRTTSLAAVGALALSLVPLGASAQEAPPARSTDQACQDVPDAGFADVAGSVHADAIDCLADLGLTEGLRGGDRYGPRQQVQRAQMASFLARFLEQATGDTSDDGPDAFADDDGSVHEDAIDALAAREVIEGLRGGGFGPLRPVTRGQVASLVTRTLDVLDGGDLDGSFPDAGSDAFSDDDGSVHEDAIDALAALGVVQGFDDGEVRPNDPVLRDQMASLLVRAYDVAVEAGLVVDGPAEPIEDDEFAATIRRTTYGVPHVEADDLGSLAYGMGYASAADTLCELMDRVITASGERSRYLGPGDGNGNVVSDAYHRRLIADGTYDALDLEPGATADSPSAEARASVRGYVAGVNRYLADTPVDDLDSRCGAEPWVQPITTDEYWRVLVTYLSSNLQQGAQFYAAPPGDAPEVTTSARLEPEPDADTVGSNAYAFGSETTENGRGVLLGNPHYPWDGPLRFYRAHLTIPGELNVVGAALINTPFVGIGHTDRVAWTHTVSTARRAGFFELTLADGDPTSYVFDDEVVPMEEVEVTVPVAAGGGAEVEVDHTYYRTPFGYLIESPNPADGLAWTEDRAYVFASTLENTRLVDQYLAMYGADDVGELFDALGAHQATAYNTTATDAEGGTLFTDAGAMPHVTDERWAACATSPIAMAFRAQRQPMLDGSRSACQWGTDEDAVVPGIFGPSNVPQLRRDDYVTQSNDSYWLTNPEQPLEGLPAIFGDERTQRSLRTRLGLVQVEDRLAGTDGLEGTGVDLDDVQDMLFANRVYLAELVRDRLVAACGAAGSVEIDGTDQDLTEACDVLAAWDTRVDVDSEGAHLFVRWAHHLDGGVPWADAFDVEDPVHTPSTLDTDDPDVLVALGRAVRELEAAGIALDATWGSVQTEPRGGARIPIHGGPGGLGVFNVITPDTPFEGPHGWTSIGHGASWVMAVEFTDDGPVSEGILTYSQSPDPASPWYADQTTLYSSEGWDPLLFDPADVRDQAISTDTIAGDG